MSGRRRTDQPGGAGGSGVGIKNVARNKRGTPVYSHEDIREQYCINDKELHALEASRRKPIFGCLTSSTTQPSPCRRKSLLPTCLRSRVPSDENIYGRSSALKSSSPTSKKQTIDYEDESYFVRRPKSICYTDPKRLASLDDSLVAKLNLQGKLDDGVSWKSSEDTERRPNQLPLSTSSEYHSAEVLQSAKSKAKNEITQRSAYTQPNTPNMPHSSKFRSAGSADANLDEKDKQKHVSFQQKSFSRSVTTEGFEAASIDAAVHRADSPKGSIKSSESKSNERLLDGPRSPEYYEQKALDQLLAPVLTKALMQGKAGNRKPNNNKPKVKRLTKREKKSEYIQTHEDPISSSSLTLEISKNRQKKKSHMTHQYNSTRPVAQKYKQDETQTTDTISDDDEVSFSGYQEDDEYEEDEDDQDTKSSRNVTFELSASSSWHDMDSICNETSSRVSEYLKWSDSFSTGSAGLLMCPSASESTLSDKIYKSTANLIFSRSDSQRSKSAISVRPIRPSASIVIKRKQECKPSSANRVDDMPTNSRESLGFFTKEIQPSKSTRHETKYSPNVSREEDSSFSNSGPSFSRVHDKVSKQSRKETKKGKLPKSVISTESQSDNFDERISFSNTFRESHSNSSTRHRFKETSNSFSQPKVKDIFTKSTEDKTRLDRKNRISEKKNDTKFVSTPESFLKQQDSIDPIYGHYLGGPLLPPEMRQRKQVSSYKNRERVFEINKQSSCTPDKPKKIKGVRKTKGKKVEKIESYTQTSFEYDDSEIDRCDLSVDERGPSNHTKVKFQSSLPSSSRTETSTDEGKIPRRNSKSSQPGTPNSEKKIKFATGHIYDSFMNKINTTYKQIQNFYDINDDEGDTKGSIKSSLNRLIKNNFSEKGLKLRRYAEAKEQSIKSSLINLSNAFGSTPAISQSKFEPLNKSDTKSLRSERGSFKHLKPKEGKTKSKMIDSRGSKQHNSSHNSCKTASYSNSLIRKPSVVVKKNRFVSKASICTQTSFSDYEVNDDAPSVEGLCVQSGEEKERDYVNIPEALAYLNISAPCLIESQGCALQREYQSNQHIPRNTSSNPNLLLSTSEGVTYRSQKRRSSSLKLKNREAYVYYRKKTYSDDDSTDDQHASQFLKPCMYSEYKLRKKLFHIEPQKTFQFSINTNANKLRKNSSDFSELDTSYDNQETSKNYVDHCDFKNVFHKAFDKNKESAYLLKSEDDGNFIPKVSTEEKVQQKKDECQACDDQIKDERDLKIQSSEEEILHNDDLTNSKEERDEPKISLGRLSYDSDTSLNQRAITDYINDGYFSSDACTPECKALTKQTIKDEHNIRTHPITKDNFHCAKNDDSKRKYNVPIDYYEDIRKDFDKFMLAKKKSYSFCFDRNDRETSSQELGEDRNETVHNTGEELEEKFDNIEEKLSIKSCDKSSIRIKDFTSNYFKDNAEVQASNLDQTSELYANKEDTIKECLKLENINICDNTESSSFVKHLRSDQEENESRSNNIKNDFPNKSQDDDQENLDSPNKDIFFVFQEKNINHLIKSCDSFFLEDATSDSVDNIDELRLEEAREANEEKWNYMNEETIPLVKEENTRYSVELAGTRNEGKTQDSISDEEECFNPLNRGTNESRDNKEESFNPLNRGTNESRDNKEETQWQKKEKNSEVQNPGERQSSLTEPVTYSHSMTEASDETANLANMDQETREINIEDSTREKSPLIRQNALDWKSSETKYENTSENQRSSVIQTDEANPQCNQINESKHEDEPILEANDSSHECEMPLEKLEQIFPSIYNEEFAENDSNKSKTNEYEKWENIAETEYFDDSRDYCDESNNWRNQTPTQRMGARPKVRRQTYKTYQSRRPNGVIIKNRNPYYNYNYNYEDYYYSYNRAPGTTKQGLKNVPYGYPENDYYYGNQSFYQNRYNQQETSAMRGYGYVSETTPKKNRRRRPRPKLRRKKAETDTGVTSTSITQKPFMHARTKNEKEYDHTEEGKDEFEMQTEVPQDREKINAERFLPKQNNIERAKEKENNADPDPKIQSMAEERRHFSPRDFEEKMKRTCMRTQATQTDAAFARKSLPHLALSPRTEKTEMVSQAAQTNGVNGRRRLVKSLSEAARYEGMEFEIYDLDGLPTPPPPPSKSIPQVLPLYPKEHSIWNFHRDNHGFHPLHNEESSESIRSEVIHRCKCYVRSESAEDILVCSPSRTKRGLLTKAMSEGEILLDRRKALSKATGYIDVDINGHQHDEDFIQPHCVNESSYDLSHSRIFSQESLGEDTDEDVFHEHLLCSTLSRQAEERKLSFSTESDLNTYEEQSFKKNFKGEENFREKPVIKPQEDIDLLKSDARPLKSQESPISDIVPTEEISPVEGSCITDISSVPETGDHLEESVSESQVTVVQKLNIQSENSLCLASDSENGSFQLTAPSSAATTPSTKHKSSFVEEIYDEAQEGDRHRFRFTSLAAVTGSSNFSSISDEQTSISETAISDSSQIVVSVSSVPSEVGKVDASLCNEDLRNKEKLLEKMVDREGQFVVSIQSRLNDVRKLTSPESDSSSSHFTEQETSRSPASAGTNTITSKSDLSRTDSHPNTDQSETSEDYITATENSTETLEMKRILLSEERRVSSPPRLDYILEDETLMPIFISPGSGDTISSLPEGHELSEASSPGLGHTSDLDTAQDLTSPDGDTTTSASYHMEVEEGGSIISQIDNFSSSPNTFSPPRSYGGRKYIKEMDRGDKDSEDFTTAKERQNTTREGKFDISKMDKKEIISKEPNSGAIKKRYFVDKIFKDDSRRYSKYMENEDGDEDSAISKEISEAIEADEITNEIDRCHSVSEEREKLKSGMKLDFPPGVTMYGEKQELEQNESNEEIHKARTIDAKTIKSVKIDTSTNAEAPVFTDISHDKKKMERSLDTRTWNENFKRQNDEVSTPGMVRSPAMHEGFRLEDWTPIRTPSTPDTFLGADTSDDSCDEANILPREKKDKNICERPRTPATILENKVPSKLNDHSVSQINHKKESYKKSSNDLENIERQMKGFATPVETLQSNINTRLENISTNHARTEISHHPPKSSIVYPGEVRRRSGDLSVGFWHRNSKESLRADENLLGPRDNLRKADSLRSFSPGSDNVFLGGSNEQLGGSRMHLCLQCGERAVSREDILKASPPHQLSYERRNHERDIRIRPMSHRARSEERAAFVKDWGMSAISLELGDAPIRNGDDDDERGVYTEAYCSFPWLYVSPTDELLAWKRDALPPPFIPPHVRIPGFSYLENNDSDYEACEDDDNDSMKRGRGSPDSTYSEKDFHTRYQAITHRMVHRKSSVEMYRRLLCRTFQADKTVYVMRGSGEFGFRIHGSRPVVVSAIESSTPAESSGLEVGDIVMAINDVNVLDASHSDVVRLAHSGSDTLRLDVARTCDLLTPLVTSDPTPICAGYLYKLGGAHHAPGSNTITRKWRRRWFALKKDHCLYYYKSELDQTPLGAVHLLDYSVHALVDGRRPYAFTVAKFGGTTLHLAARTEDARNRWGQVVTQAALEAAQRDELIEESTRRVQQSPGAIATPDCFGYLYKLGMRWHQWKRRYCVLKDACLYFFYDTDATSAIGVVHLHGYRVQSTSIGGKKYTFELIPPDAKFRHFYFCTDSDNDKKRWLAGLEYSIDRWIKVG